MSNFLFRLGDENKPQMQFMVLADSLDQAIQRANAAFEDNFEGEDTYIGEYIHHAHYFTERNEGAILVDSSHFVEEVTDLPAFPQLIFDLLLERGYTEGDSEYLNRCYDEKLEFSRPLLCAHGVFGFFNVESHWDYNTNDWSFFIKVTQAMVPIHREPEEFQLFNIEFTSGMTQISPKNLVEMLDMYECKFMRFLYQLRETEFKELLPLTEQEEQHSLMLRNNVKDERLENPLPPLPDWYKNPKVRNL